MLETLGGGSPFLADLAVREHDTAITVFDSGPDATVAQALAQLAETDPAAPRAAVAAAMRRAKRVVALAAALADIGGWWTLAEVTAALSTLAESTLRLAVGHLLLAAHTAGQLALPDPARPEHGSGLIVLGMGKLGARELNYSSDIDLVMFYDPAAHPDADSLGATFTRIARGLVTLMEARDADGYVFRTDLRLRPDPAATPPAVALPAALAYYESLGQNWERAAMTKARPVAGDLVRGRAFLDAIRPFVWRRHLDFAAIADLGAMKRRIDMHRGFVPETDPAGLPGWNVKLGPGGIREIEFAVQTLQLVWGGRDPALRDATTLGGLRRLARAGHIARRAAAELTVAYRLLRRTEHRLQMVADRQTHTLPEKPDELARFAVFMGCDDGPALCALVARHAARVRARYAEVFGPVPDLVGVVPLDLSGPDLPEDTATRLRALGFHTVEAMGAVLRGWQAGRMRALRSTRARELMATLLPALLAALATQSDPDGAFVRFDAMLSRQTAGVPLLSTLERNPGLLARIAGVLGAAPWLADHLASVPSALEGLLAPAAAQAIPPATLLAARLSGTPLPEEVIAVASPFVRAEEFRLCCGQLDGTLDVDAAGYARTALADAALGALLPAVLRDQGRKHGWVRGGDMAVVALGKTGSREMMAGSDLDLMLLYSHPPGVTDSSGGPHGARHLPASQWFIRAAHAFVAALTAPGRDGPLYAIDMRLRPSGNKGPVAVPLPGFVRYHAGESWTWERMALTRARVVAGNPAIRGRATRAIAAALARPADPAQTRADAADMRRRLLRELPPTGPWDVKMRAGGGMEVEFVAQVLQLACGPYPGCQTTADAVRALARDGALSAPEAEALVRADRLWRTVQSAVRITVGRGAVALPAPAADAVLRAVRTVSGFAALDLPALPGTLDATAAAVRRIFEQRIGSLS